MGGEGRDGRVNATMAALVEEARWRTSKKGTRFLSATLSDESGQFQANCFDEEASADLDELGRNGGCALLGVELERSPGEETPRVTVRRAQRLDALAGAARLRAVISVTEAAAVAVLAEMLAVVRGGKSEVLLRVATARGGEADVRLGRDFLLDGELATTIGRIEGVSDVSLTAQELPKLALVS
jgi:DNA polymerase-3 subunit alpha